MLSFECIKNEKSVYFLLTSAERRFLYVVLAQMPLDSPSTGMV